jgi:hypothetical protein
MKRHVSAYLEVIFGFTNAGYMETNVGTVWLDVEISTSALHSGGYIYIYIYIYICVCVCVCVYV